MGRGTRYEVYGQLILRSDLALLPTMFDLKQRDISVNKRDRAILRSNLALVMQTMFDVTLWPFNCPHTSYLIPRPV